VFPVTVAVFSVSVGMYAGAVSVARRGIAGTSAGRIGSVLFSVIAVGGEVVEGLIVVPRLAVVLQVGKMGPYDPLSLGNHVIHDLIFVIGLRLSTLDGDSPFGTVADACA
jgi:hypothetical protein